MRRREGSQIIRKWISGFANSDGGILIVGVNEPADKNEPRKITACEARIGGQTPEEWATRCLSLLQLAMTFIKVVEVTDLQARVDALEQLVNRRNGDGKPSAKS